jgi:hypothetical protein
MIGYYDLRGDRISLIVDLHVSIRLQVRVQYRDALVYS